MDVYTSVVMAAIGRIIAFSVVVLGSFGALLLAPNACGKGVDWKGDWVGTRSIPVRPEASPDVVNTIRHVTLSVKDNWDYELHVSGVPSNGIFHPEGKEASLQPINMLDRPVDDKTPWIKLKANDDGTITLLNPDNLDPNSILLHRESQPTASNVRNR